MFAPCIRGKLLGAHLNLLYARGISPGRYHRAKDSRWVNRHKVNAILLSDLPCLLLCKGLQYTANTTKQRARYPAVYLGMLRMLHSGIHDACSSHVRVQAHS